MQTLYENPSRRPRVLIADDHAIFAETLRTYLEKTCSIIGVVADGRAMLQEAIRLRPDVVVADISMPLLNGLDAARGIRERAPKVAFVFLTMLDDANLAAAAIELGSVGFLLKSSGGLELLNAIEATLHNRSYLTPKLRAEDWVAAKARARQFSRGLTVRQRDVVRLFAEGRPVKEIACFSPQLERKDGGIPQAPYHGSVQSQEQRSIVLFALKKGLISVDSESSLLAS